jgi:hypothetical protein
LIQPASRRADFVERMHALQMAWAPRRSARCWRYSLVKDELLTGAFVMVTVSGF